MDKKVKQIINSTEYHKLLHEDLGNGIYLNEIQKEILDEYQIPYRNCKDIHELLFLLENSGEKDLEGISLEIAEFNYYHNTRK